MQSQQPTQSRCLRTFSDGRGCRMLRKAGHPALCVFHAREEEQLLETEKLAAELASLSGNLNTGLDINHVLGKVFQALAQRRISPREATAFAYIAQLMLQSMPYVKNEIRWATNDAEAYYRMIRQSIPAVRDLPKSQSTPPPPLPTRRPAPTRATTPAAQQSTASVPAPAPPPRPQPPTQQQVSSAPSPMSNQPPNAPNPVNASTPAPVPTHSQPAPRTSFVGAVRSPVWSQ
jgi:hypothetical protein